MTSDEETHRAILDAIRSGDPARGEEVMRRHIQEAAHWLLERMQSVDWQRVNVS